MAEALAMSPENLLKAKAVKSAEEARAEEAKAEAEDPVCCVALGICHPPLTHAPTPRRVESK